jgi:hypothetical protein
VVLIIFNLVLQFLDVLERELAKVEKNKNEFVSDFSQVI